MRRPSKHQTYKEAIATALGCLEEAEGHAMSALLNIAFSGPEKKLGRLYEEGDIFTMEPAMFADTGDANIDIILEMLYKMHDAKESIKNLNGIGGE